MGLYLVQKMAKDLAIDLQITSQLSCGTTIIPVSYTHLDVYKRQEGNSSNAVNQRSYNINNGTIMGYGIL